MKRPFKSEWPYVFLMLTVVLLILAGEAIVDWAIPDPAPMPPVLLDE